jgi:hypothetical protein
MTCEAEEGLRVARLAGFVDRVAPVQGSAQFVETMMLLHGTGGDAHDLRP